MDSDCLSNYSSVRAGEQFLFQIYTMIRESPYRDKILFLISFDEGGGMADYVPPPRTQSPYVSSKLTEMNFDFQILGQRVPFVAISSWIPKGSVIKKQLQHSSLIRSVCKKFKIPYYSKLLRLKCTTLS